MELAIDRLAVKIARGADKELIAAVNNFQGDAIIGSGAGARVMVATRPVDFCKGPESLATLVGVEYGGDPFSDVIYVFKANVSTGSS